MKFIRHLLWPIRSFMMDGMHGRVCSLIGHKPVGEYKLDHIEWTCKRCGDLCEADGSDKQYGQWP